jgi:hypothetical protein
MLADKDDVMKYRVDGVGVSSRRVMVAYNLYRQQFIRIFTIDF